MTDADLIELLCRHGVNAKFVRAYCRAMGWRHQSGDNGAPAEWYQAFQGDLGIRMSRLLDADRAT